MLYLADFVKIKRLGVLDQIRIVLVNTTHPGNIGAAARAMKTMGLQHLYLVNPYRFPHAEAVARATHATDILDNAKICKNLEEAISDCVAVFGASSRSRSVTVPLLNPREAAQLIKQNDFQQTVAILFGRESDGLTNNELDCCQHLIKIPGNPEYSVLNLAAAVQVIAYELRMGTLMAEEAGEKVSLGDATGKELAGLWRHLEQMLIDIDFLNPKNPGYVVRRLQRVLQRAHLSSREVKILRGVFKAAQKHHENT